MKLPVRLLSLILVTALAFTNVDIAALLTEETIGTPVDAETIDVPVTIEETENEETPEDEATEELQEPELIEEAATDTEEEENEASDTANLEMEEKEEEVLGDIGFIYKEGSNGKIVTGVSGASAGGDSVIVIPEGVEEIAASAFKDQTFASVTFPASLKKIGEYAFYKSLTPTFVFNGADDLVIEKSAFMRCTSITSIVLPVGTKEVGLTAFACCTSLTNVTLPPNVAVGSAAFSRCTNLKNFTVPKGMTVLYNYNFVGYKNDNQGANWDHCGPFGKPSTSTAGFLIGEDTHLTTITFADANTEKIPDYLFSNYGFDLPANAIPSKVKTIGKNAFYSAAITSIKLPDSVTTIEKEAFRHCSGLTTVVIGPNVETIGDYAFDGANSELTFVVASGSKTYTTLLATKTTKKYAINSMNQVTYVLNGGENDSANVSEVAPSTTSITVKDPTRSGYTFNGWYLNSALTKAAGTYDAESGTTTVNIDGNLFLYAAWTKPVQKRNIIFDLSSVPAAVRENVNNPNPTEYVVGEGLTLEEPTLEGFVFKFWYEGDYAFSNYARQSIGPNEDRIVTLKPYFLSKDYAITYRDQGNKPYTGGYLPKEFAYWDGLTLTDYTPKKAGYTAAGYYLDSACSASPITEIGAYTTAHPVTIYVKWTENTYTIKFDKNSGAASGAAMADISGLYSEEKQLTANTYAVADKTFIGWSLKSEDDTILYKDAATVQMSDVEKYDAADGATDKTITLYAQYAKPVEVSVNLKNCSVFFSDGDSIFTYNPNGIKPANIVVAGVVATENGVKTYQNLVEGVDYKLEYPTTEKAGKNTVKVLPIDGNTKVTGSNSITYTINPINYEDAVGENTYVESEKLEAGLTYTGSKLTADDIKVVIYGKELAATDYTVKYANNINAANLSSAKVPTATITLKGNYKGTVTIKFVINPASITGYTAALAAEKMTYTGKELKPKASITYLVGEKKKSLAASNYTVIYSNNTNKGTATATFTGKGNYTGTLTKTFEIEAKSLSKAKLTFKYSKYTYDGTSSTAQEVKVYDGKSLLEKDTDYTITGADGKNVGSYEVVVTGKGNYKDEAKKSYSIVAQTVAKAVKLNKTYFKKGAMGEGPSLEYIVSDASENLQIKSGSLTNTEAGEYTVIVEPKSGVTNYVKTATLKYKIGTATEIDTATVTLSDSRFIYDGSDKKPAVTSVVLGTKALKATDYTISYQNCKNAGTAKVVITGKGNYTGSVTKEYTIEAKSLGDTTVTIKNTPVYSAKAMPANVIAKIGKKTLSTKTDYEIVYYDIEYNPCDVPVNAGIYYVSACAKEGSNYKGSSELVEYRVFKRGLDTFKITFSPTKYTSIGNPPKVVSVKYGNTSLVENTDYKIYTFSDDSKLTYKVTVSALGTSQNSVGSYVKTFSIAKQPSLLRIEDNPTKIVSNTVQTVDLRTLAFAGYGCTFAVKSATGTRTNKNDFVKDQNDILSVPANYIGRINLTVTCNAAIAKAETKTFYIDFVLPDYGTLELKNDGEQAVKVKVTKTATSEFAQGYKVMYSTSPNMSKAKAVTMADDGTGKITGLKVGQKYYLAVYTTYTVNNKTYTTLNKGGDDLTYTGEIVVRK